MSDPNTEQQEQEQASAPLSVVSLDASEKRASEKIASEKLSSEKFFGELAPLARIVSLTTSVLDEETRMVADRSPLSALRVIAQQKEALLAQHDLQLLRLKSKTDNLSTFVSKLDQGARVRLRALYSRFEKALRQNGLRLKAALASSEMLLAALSEAAQDESVKGPQLYTPQGRLSETGSVSFSRSVASENEV